MFPFIHRLSHFSLLIIGAEKTMFLKFSLDLVHKLLKSETLQVCYHMKKMLYKISK